MSNHDDYIEYDVEELLEVVARLTDKYTSKESSSVTYETAEQLMEAVIYCVNECKSNTSSIIDINAETVKVEALYENGYKIVIEKVHEANSIYERIIDSFEGFGCTNYIDTILKGMPAFFINYDAKFNPQNHLLTLDYPVMIQDIELNGVDLILDYLKKIELEIQFLQCFTRGSVISLLERIQTNYKSLYYDNICYPVLFHAVASIIAEKEVIELNINSQDCEEIEFYFRDEDINQITLKIESLINIMTDKMNIVETKEYLCSISRDYAVRIWNALQNNSLEELFCVKTVI